MRVVYITENQKETWNKFIAENNSESFLQTWEWGEFNRALGRKIWRIGIVEDDFFNEKETKNTKYQIPNTKYDLLMVALIVKYDLPLERSYLYCPRGPMICESRIASFLFKEIRKIAEREKSLFLRFDPPVKKNLESGIWNLENNFPLLSPEYSGEGSGEVFKTPFEIQPKNTLILDLTKSEEELLKEMKPKTRYNIRLAEKKELRITNYELRTGNHESQITNQKSFKEKFEEFWKLTEETSRRDNFKSHSKYYYWKMLENLKRVPVSLKETGTHNLQARLYFAEYENKIIAANIVLFFGDYCVYLHGASSSEQRNLMAPYLLQWRQVLDAKKRGCKKYDFWGVSPTNKDIVELPPVSSFARRGKYNWDGITRFKRGFGGKEINYIGAYNLVFSKFWYRLYRVARRVKNNFSFFSKKH